MSFQLHESQGLTWLTSESLSLPGLAHGFSTRPGGVSCAPWDSLNLGISRGDDPDHVRENYRRFCAVVGMDPLRTVLSRQDHHDNILHVTSDDAGKGLWRERDYQSVDALICDEPDIPIAVFSADCGVILLFDPVHRAIGAVHAGWRGTAMGLVKKTALTMADTFGTDPKDLICAIGPSIGQCCFETDDDVPTALRQALGSNVEAFMERRGEKWHIDLKSINAWWLRSLGVAHIDICDHCTVCRPDLYWSHRRSGNARGVQAAMISLISLG